MATIKASELLIFKYKHPFFVDSLKEALEPFYRACFFVWIHE